MIPGVYLGSEESTEDFSWCSSRPLVKILNVALEIEDPFATSHSIKGKARETESIRLATYDAKDGGPAIDYCHLSWSHGESNLADIPTEAMLDHMLAVEGDDYDDLDASWGFWRAIQWIEAARRIGVPVLIQYVPPLSQADRS